MLCPGIVFTCSFLVLPIQRRLDVLLLDVLRKFENGPVHVRGLGCFWRGEGGEAALEAN